MSTEAGFRDAVADQTNESIASQSIAEFAALHEKIRTKDTRIVALEKQVENLQAQLSRNEAELERYSNEVYELDFEGKPDGPSDGQHTINKDESKNTKTRQRKETKQELKKLWLSLQAEQMAIGKKSHQLQKDHTAVQFSFWLLLAVCEKQLQKMKGLQRVGERRSDWTADESVLETQDVMEHDGKIPSVSLQDEMSMLESDSDDEVLRGHMDASEEVSGLHVSRRHRPEGLVAARACSSPLDTEDKDQNASFAEQVFHPSSPNGRAVETSLDGCIEHKGTAGNTSGAWQRRRLFFFAGVFWILSITAAAVYGALCFKEKSLWLMANGATRDHLLQFASSIDTDWKVALGRWAWQDGS